MIFKASDFHDLYGMSQYTATDNANARFNSLFNKLFGKEPPHPTSDYEKGYNDALLQIRREIEAEFEE